MSNHTTSEDSQDQTRHEQEFLVRRRRLLESFKKRIDDSNDSTDCQAVIKGVAQLVLIGAEELDNACTAAKGGPEAISSLHIFGITDELHMNLDTIQHLLNFLGDSPFRYQTHVEAVQALQQAHDKSNLDSYDFFAGLAFGCVVGMLGVLVLALIIEVQMQHLGCSQRIGAMIGSSLCFFAFVYFFLLSPCYRPRGE